jgi:hypothetical protein
MLFRPTLENYFNYFTEIEHRYLQRRGGGLLLSTLDWALIETWKDAGIPLEAALRGIDAAFDRYHQRPSKTKKVNSLAYCSQEVLAAAEDIQEAGVGAATGHASENGRADEGFEPEHVAVFLRRNADMLERRALANGSEASRSFMLETAKTVRHLAEETAITPVSRLEDLERRLTVLEEKLFAMLLASTPDDEILGIRVEADRDLAPYRRKMSAAQIDQLQKQYIHKRLLEKYQLPRLSLFYM